MIRDCAMLYDNIKELHEEKERLQYKEKMLKASVEISTNSQKKRGLKENLNSLRFRLEEIRTIIKGTQSSYDRLLIDVFDRSLSTEVKKRIEAEVLRVIKHGAKIEDIRPVNLFSEKDLNLKQELTDLQTEVKVLRVYRANSKKEASRIFQICNGRLTPDEATQFKELLDFLRTIINQ